MKKSDYILLAKEHAALQQKHDALLAASRSLLALSVDAAGSDYTLRQLRCNPVSGKPEAEYESLQTAVDFALGKLSKLPATAY